MSREPGHVLIPSPLHPTADVSSLPVEKESVKHLNVGGLNDMSVQAVPTKRAINVCACALYVHMCVCFVCVCFCACFCVSQYRCLSVCACPLWCVCVSFSICVCVCVCVFVCVTVGLCKIHAYAVFAFVLKGPSLSVCVSLGPRLQRSPVRSVADIISPAIPHPVEQCIIAC